MTKLKHVIITLVILLYVSQKSNAQKIHTYTLDAATLKHNKSKIANKDADIMPAYKKLISDADKKALAFAPVTVLEKTNLPPSGNKHDYMSIAPYFWPDPSKPNGLPYIRKDGQTNPEVKDYKDKDYMPKLCEHVYTLALAYYFSDDEKYADHAAKLLRVWFLDTATKMNPNLNYAQAVKGVNEGRGAGLIDTRHFIKVVDAVGILNSSKYWKKNDMQGMKQWFSDFLNWMQTSKNGIEEMNAKNNHGIWYDAQRLSFALFVDSSNLAKKILANAANRLDYQLNSNGDFPAELERTISLHYTCFVLNAFTLVATMSEKTGFDFWHHVTPTGKSLQKAYSKLTPYLLQERKWEGPQIKDFETADSYPLLISATTQFNCKNCKSYVSTLSGDEASKLRLWLLY